jgi:hypothetical protein
MELVIIWLWYYLYASNREIICVIQTEPNISPSYSQIVEACPISPEAIEAGLYELYTEPDFTAPIIRELYKVEKQQQPDLANFCHGPAIANGPGILEKPQDHTGLATNNKYNLLEFNLLWYGLSVSSVEWQNKLDAAIYQESLAANIPPRLLKSIIATEAQFWPLWEPDASSHGEQGLIQLTEAGADLTLRYDEGLYKSICPGIIYNCKTSYHRLSIPEQKLLARAMVAGLSCQGCYPLQAMAKEEANIIIYARVIKAYGCKNGYNWVEAMREFNGSSSYPISIGLQ